MTQPQLIFAEAIGQSAIRVLFDQPMRQLGVTASEDPANPANWSVAGGLPAVIAVDRLSSTEFELVLASSAPLAAGYTVTVSGTVQNMETPVEVMDPGFVTPPAFAVTVADLVASSVTWVSPTEVSFLFSENLEPITFVSYDEVVSAVAVDSRSRPPVISGITSTGATVNVKLAAAGTAGASYEFTFVRDKIVGDPSATTLDFESGTQYVWGQGAAPYIAAGTLREDQVEVTSSEVLGSFPTSATWPLIHGLYKVDQGTLGPQEPLSLGTTPAVLEADGAELPTGATVAFDISKVSRTLVTGASIVGEADNVVGAGSELVGATTTLNKIPGAPYELVFNAGSGSISQAGRTFNVGLDISFTSGPTSFPLVAVTLLNTQTSIVIEKLVDDTAVLKIYRGSLELSQTSAPFDPTIPFSLGVVDATGESGFFAVTVDGIVVLGAPAAQVLDPALTQTNVGATAIALILGSPASVAEVFSVELTTDLVVQSYLGIGLRGVESYDLFSFPGSTFSAAVLPPATGATSGGYDDSGKPAFSAYAESLTDSFISAIQVVVAFNSAAVRKEFTGSATLLTGSGSPMDQVVFDQSYKLMEDDSVACVFLNPQTWLGALVNVSISIDEVDYQVTVPVVELGASEMSYHLAPQPQNWYHKRLSNSNVGTNIADFGPAVIIDTP